jgi:hypothetical protein
VLRFTEPGYMINIHCLPAILSYETGSVMNFELIRKQSDVEDNPTVSLDNFEHFYVIFRDNTNWSPFYLVLTTVS